MFYICLLNFYIVKLFGENQNRQSFSFEPINFNYGVRASMNFLLMQKILRTVLKSYFLTFSLCETCR